MQKQLTTGPVMPTMLQFAVPMILGDLLQQCYNIADTLIVGGTSLAVYPAAGLLRYFRGENLVVINKQPTPADGMANLLIRGPIGRALDPAAPEES